MDDTANAAASAPAPAADTSADRAPAAAPPTLSSDPNQVAAAIISQPGLITGELTPVADAPSAAGAPDLASTLQAVAAAQGKDWREVLADQLADRVRAEAMPPAGPLAVKAEAAFDQAVDLLPASAATKSALKSKTVWGVAMMVAGYALPALAHRYGLTAADTDAFLQFGGQVLGLAGTAMTLIGRLTARRTLT